MIQDVKNESRAIYPAFVFLPIVLGDPLRDRPLKRRASMLPLQFPEGRLRQMHDVRPPALRGTGTTQYRRLHGFRRRRRHVRAVVFAGGEGERLCQRRRFLALGDEQLDKVRLERKQLLGDPLDLGRVVFVLKQ
jgi:hypothetical protein